MADTVQLKALPTVMPDVGQETVTTRAWGATVTLALADALALAESVAVTDTVLLPLEAHVIVIELVVEEPEHPAGRVQAKVNGPVPPVAVAVQLNGLPAVKPVVGHATVTVGGVTVDA